MLPSDPQGYRGTSDQQPTNNPAAAGLSNSATVGAKKKRRRFAVRIPTDRVTSSKHTERLEQAEIDNLMTNVRRSLEFGERYERIGTSLVDPFVDLTMSDGEIDRQEVVDESDERKNFKLWFRQKLNELRHELHTNTLKLDLNEK